MPGRRTLPPRLDLIVLGLAIVAALGLRLYRLGDQNVWWDEAYSIYLARKGLLALALETAGDVHPPLHYWLLHIWIRLVGEGEFAVRYASVWLGVLGVPLIYWLGRRTFGRGVGLVAALLLASSRFHVEWSQQIRMYTLVADLTVLSVALTLRLWEAPRRRLWVAHAALTTAGLYILYLSGLVALIESVVTALLWVVPLGGRRLKTSFVLRWAAAQTAALAIFLPWVVLYLRAPRPTPAVLFPIDLLTFLHASATAFPLGVSAYLERYTPTTLAALCLLALAVPVVVSRDRRRAGALLFALVLVPPVVVYGLSFPNPVLYAPNLSVRYLLVFLPAYCLLLAAAAVVLWSAPLAWTGARRRDSAASRLPTSAEPGAVNAPRPGGRVAAPASPGLVARAAAGLLAAGLLVGATAWSLSDYYPARRLVDDYQTVASYLRAYARPGDAVVLSSDRDWPIYLYYTGDLPWYGVGSLRPISSQGAADLLGPALAAHPGLWLLTSDGAYDSDPGGQVPAWLAARARLVGEVSGPRRHLALYSTDPNRGVDVPARVSPGHPVGASFEGGPEMVGYDLATADVAPAESLRLAVYWRASRPIPTDAWAMLRLVDSRGLPYRSARFPLGQMGALSAAASGRGPRADYAMPIPRAMPAGRYRLTLGVAVGDRELVSAAGGTTVSLQEVRVIGPPGPIAARPAARWPTDFTLGDGIRLAGFDLALSPARDLARGLPARADLAAGTTLRLRLYWEDLQAVDRAYTVFVQLVGEQTNPATGNPVWAQRDTYPSGGQRPTDDWVPGEVIVDDHELLVPVGAPLGRYTLHVGMYDVPTGRRLSIKGAGTALGDSVVLFEGSLAP